ncbi:MAG: YkgJ family cysteine cluster protein [Treponema sp.]|jgi:Fe-S-cluster containining protein|nr:YkgJ family cysteine cluster protein [Treponema sp.]
MTAFYSGGLRFSCTRCSACCGGESGYVFLSAYDLKRLCAVTALNSDTFCREYCRWIPFSTTVERLSLKEKANFDCIFLDNTGCSIYSARPQQCRSFPFWISILQTVEQWESMAHDCPGMNYGILYSNEDIQQWIVQQQNEQLITRNR